MMSSWSVAIEASLTEDLTADEISVLHDELQQFAPSVGTNEDGSLGVQLAIEARTVTGAVDTASKALRDALRSAGLKVTVVAVQAMPWEKFEESLRSPVVPQLVGVSEIAEMLAVSKQRVTQLSERDDWPPAVARLSAGPVWTEKSVDHFKRNWQRKRTGRPKKPVTA